MYAKNAGLGECINRIKKIIADNKGAPIGALMGIAMAKLRGKADGKIVNELLKKLMS